VPISTIGRWQERWIQGLYRNVPFWTPSDSTKKDLAAHGVHDVTVIRNGIDMVPLPSLEEKRLEAPLRLICVSRMAPNKRVDHAIRAMKCLADRNIPAKLQLVGDGECRPALEQLTKTLGLQDRVQFSGWLPGKEKNAEMQRAHFLIHASQREGWGLNVIEANAMGTPAVVYPVGGLVDSTLSGQTGVVTDAETPESLANALADIVKNPSVYSRYRINAWERSKTFSWPAILAETTAWLESHAKRK